MSAERVKLTDLPKGWLKRMEVAGYCFASAWSGTGQALKRRGLAEFTPAPSYDHGRWTLTPAGLAALAAGDRS